MHKYLGIKLPLHRGMFWQLYPTNLLQISYRNLTNPTNLLQISCRNITNPNDLLQISNRNLTNPTNMLQISCINLINPTNLLQISNRNLTNLLQISYKYGNTKPGKLYHTNLLHSCQIKYTIWMDINEKHEYENFRK